MADKTVPLSVRMTPEDMAMLSSLRIADAVTPSEKLRRLVRTAHRQQEGRRDFEEALKVEEERMLPLLHRIRALEAKHRVHSEFLLHVAHWLPDMCAAAAAALGRIEQTDGPDSAVQGLEEAEAGLADRVFGLMLTILNFSLAPKAHFYRPETAAERLAPVLDIARLLNRDTKTEEGD